MLGLESPDVFVKNPERILEAFLIQERHPDIPMKSSRLYRALFEAHSLMNKEWAENPVNRQTFLKIIQGTPRRLACPGRDESLGRTRKTAAKLQPNRRSNAA